MLNISVKIDKNSGFCFGVIYAIDIAEEILDEEGHLYCLGDIVHNDEEIKRLEKKGLKIIDHSFLRTLENEKVLIRAHGEPPSTYELALKNNLQLIDASCPVVLKLQNRIRKAYEKNEHILIYGKQGHAEVLGLVGQTGNKATVFQKPDDLELDSMPGTVTLFSQTTKSVSKFHEIAATLQLHGVNVKVNDTICRQVSNRDEELRQFALEYDKIIFVSGTKSSNGRVLFQVCRETNPNSYFISRPEELKKSWFSKNDRVGVCGATSTPMWLMKKIKRKLESY